MTASPKLDTARHLTAAALTLVASVIIGSYGAAVATEGVDRREFSVAGRDYAFTPSRLEVAQDDLVKIEFHADDIPHSFTIDSYRISKRSAVGQRVVFEFRADRAGTFPFYCSLANDERCRGMRGELIVTSH